MGNRDSKPPPPPGNFTTSHHRAFYPPAPPPLSATGTYEEHQQTTAFGRAPPQPLFPWQFVGQTQAKLVEVRQSRQEEAEEQRRKRQAQAGPQPKEVEECRPHPASTPPEDGTCLLDLLPREILLYILQDVGEETLAVDCPLVSHQLRDLANDEHLWKHLYLVDYGRMPPNFQPPSKYSHEKWHRQPTTQKEEYYHKVWKWYESYGGSIHDNRTTRFTQTVRGWLGVSPHAYSRMALLGAISSFDHRKLRKVQTNDRSAPIVRPPPMHGRFFAAMAATQRSRNGAS